MAVYVTRADLENCLSRTVLEAIADPAAIEHALAVAEADVLGRLTDPGQAGSDRFRYAMTTRAAEILWARLPHPG